MRTMKYVFLSCVLLLSPLLGEAKNNSTVSKTKSKPEERKFMQCDPEQGYQRNNCDYCSCKEENGKFQFTCFNGEVCNGDEYEKLKNCKAGTDYQNSCNHCWCLPNEGTMCTNQLCYTKK